MYYCLDSDLISIDKISGDIEVKAINRDALNQEVFPFSVCSLYCVSLRITFKHFTFILNFTTPLTTRSSPTSSTIAAGRSMAKR